MNGVDAMPVRIKAEPHDGLAPRSAPPAPIATNGFNAHHRPPLAPTHPHNRGPGSARVSMVSSAGGQGCVPPAVPGANGFIKEKEAAPAVSEDAVDYDSVRGVFGWATLDGTNVPYIIRKYRKFVAVRIVEKKMLSKYPNSFPDELGKKDPLISYFVTEAEAKLLNEINTIHCSYEYGQQPFSTKDLIVDLTEFEEFFKLVKKTFPDEVLATMSAEENGSSPVDDKKAALSKVCGWMQINNTVTPYIVRSSGKFVPLSVILYAAQLLTKESVEGHLPTEQECVLLNSTCQGAGFDFTFGKNTRLIHISEVVRRCQVRIFELPFENPLQHAQYIDSLQQSELSGVPPHPPPAPSVVPGNMSLPYQSKPIVSEGPPNFHPFNPYNPFVSMANMMSQTSAPRHRSEQTASSVAMSAATQLVSTQSAPIFFPPAPPSSMSRGSQSNSHSALPQHPGNQTHSSSGIVPGLQTHNPALASGVVPNNQRHSLSGIVPGNQRQSPLGIVPGNQRQSPSGVVPGNQRHSPSGIVPGLQTQNYSLASGLVTGHQTHSPSGVAAGHQTHSPSGMGPPRAPSPQAGSSQGRMGSPSGLAASHASTHPSGFHPHFVRGGPGVSGRFHYPGIPVSGASAIPRLPPPYLPPHPHLMQRLGQPPMSGQHGPGPHPFMPPPPHFSGQQNQVMIPGVGPVPRGALHMMGYPHLPSGLPPQMAVTHTPDQLQHLPNPNSGPSQQAMLPPYQLQAYLQSTSRPPSQPGVQPQVARSSASSIVHASRNSPPSGVGVARPSLSAPQPQGQAYPTQPTIFPVQLSPASARLPGADAATLPTSHQQSKPAVLPAPDEHLKLVASIKAVMSHGKSISCMRRDCSERKGNLCLVEAVAKLYFPKCSLAEFVHALRNVLQINLPVCTQTEAKAFIHFYNLPVTSLNDNHMIDLDDLNNYFPQISYMFRHAAADSSTALAGKPPVMNTTRRSNGTEGTTRLASPSAPITIVLNNNDSAEVISIDSGPPTPVSDSPTVRKRAGGGLEGSGVKVNRCNSSATADEVDGPTAGAENTVTTDTPTVSNSSTTRQATTSQVIVID
ncbi:uncharacterized protein [Littorina saxatilis]|uniref:uncharacterized protein isoform X2 n=1 Tax=Littorina saxatilis TaxID=31220 RepID=UPI0038B56153